MNLFTRLYRKVKRTENGCLEWTGYRNKAGYGMIKHEGKALLTHRVAVTEGGLTLGVDDVVMHTCDNPPCVERSHLTVGTQADNVADMKAKGRGNNGRGSSKLTEAAVVEIIERYSDRKTSTAAIASIYGVSQPTISYILIGKTWKHIPRNF